MTRVRVATFNVENLFARYKFNRNVDPQTAVVDGWNANQRRFSIYNEDSKEITGSLLNDLDADVLALQEVENLDTLKRFRSEYLGGRREYPHVFVVDGNDPRRIDVAVLSRFPILGGRSWQHLWESSWNYYVFSRDCLEVDIQMPDHTALTLYNNHFKSMMGGRAATRYKRKRQSDEVKSIVESRFGRRPGGSQFVILGDFNDYRGTGSGITDLVSWNQVEDVVRRLPSSDRWTHYWAGGNQYHQIDYVLLSKSLASRNPEDPVIERSGLPFRATRYSGERYVGIGSSSPKASDHCPVSLDLNF